MHLSPQQLAFFEVFGYVHLPRALLDDIVWITDEFERVFTMRPDKRHDGSRSTEIVPFIDHSERLCTLLDHPAIVGPATGILGEDFNYVAGDGKMYSGDTGWHSDAWIEHQHLLKIKVAIYLDALTAETGCLRVIPGSHVPGTPFGDRLHRYWREQGSSPDVFGLPMSGIPSMPLETMPGDIVIFNHRLMHASFGGGRRRRMFTLNLHRRADTPEAFEQLQTYISQHCLRCAPRSHSQLMLRTAGPARMRHLRQVIEAEERMGIGAATCPPA